MAIINDEKGEPGGVAAAVIDDVSPASSHGGGLAADGLPTPAANLRPAMGTKFKYPSGARPLPGYTLKRGIGVGGFGEVYFALNDAGKEVALKRIQRNLDIELRGVRQCLNLKHINLITLWDIQTCQEGETWVVMEFVPGPSLRDVIEHHPNGIPVEEVERWFVSACSGVAYLHDRGIVHRDLKPGNIFFDEDAQLVKIGDYGLSKFISCSRRDVQTESVGTFHYMAPEIGRGVYGKEIDVYALGIILCEMSTGRLPFDGESGQEIIMKHLTADPCLDAVAPAYRPLILKALAKDPAQRYRSVQEMLAAFPIGKSAPISATSHGPRVPPVIRQPDDLHATHAAITTNPVARGGAGPLFIGEEISFGEVIHKPTEQPRVHAASMAQKVAPIVPPRELPNEPIARGLLSAWDRAMTLLNGSSVGIPLKILIIVAVVILILSYARWLLPFTLTLGFMYLVYYAVRAWTVPSEPAPQTRVPQVQLSASQAREMLRVQWSGSRRRRVVRELASSLLISTIAVVVLSILAALALVEISADAASPLPLTVWAIGTCLMLSWSLVICGKCWEDKPGEGWLRRLTLAGLGLGIGAASFYLAMLLQLDWSLIARQPADASSFSPIDRRTLTEFGAPTLGGTMLFFALLLGVLRWWKLVDPLRRARLSVWGVGICLIWAVVLGHLLHYPAPWHAVIAIVTAASIQLAVPYLTAAQRYHLQYRQPRQLA